MMVQNDKLDALFEEAAAQKAMPSAGLMTRILADADALQPKPLPWRVTSPEPKGWFNTFAGWFGGGGSLVGMSAAAATGLYFGVAQPASFLALSELVTGAAVIDSLELLPSDSALWAME
jgi:hypothetical protein